MLWRLSQNTREIEPTIAEIKEDLKILAALNIKIVRTYNVHYKEVSNLLEAITQLKKEDSNFKKCILCLELGLIVKRLDKFRTHS